MKIWVAPEPEYPLIGLDIETFHGQTWGYDSRILFGAAMQVEDGKMRYLRPKASVEETREFFWPLRDMAEDFVVVAHNGQFDLAGVSGWLQRYGAEPLPDLRLSDTYRHTYKVNGVYSKSLANTARMLDVPFPKGHVERYDWEEAILYDAPDALRLIKEYNENDVRLLFPVREGLLARNQMRYPFKIWRP